LSGFSVLELGICLGFRASLLELLSGISAFRAWNLFRI
jgi:hypothetical protein